MLHRSMTILPAMVLTLTSLVMAADPDINILKNSGSLDRLFKKSGVYNASTTGKTPGFVVDPVMAAAAAEQLAAGPDRRALCRPARPYLGLQPAAHDDQRRGWARRTRAGRHR